MVSKDVQDFNRCVAVTGEALRQNGYDRRDDFEELRRIATGAVMAVTDPERLLRGARGGDREALRRDLTEIVTLGAAALGYDLVKKGK